MEYQKLFIEVLRKAVPPNISLAEEVSSILKVSADSAYRRLRCETDLSLDETVALCRYFDIPLDTLTSGTPNAINFSIHNLNANLSSFSSYLQSLDKDLNWMNRFDNRELIYAAEDLPVFYSFFFPELAKFKLGYWNKSILNVQEVQGMMVEDISLPEGWQEMVHNIVSSFLKVRSVEIWNEDTLKSTTRQIRFYWEAGFFRKRETAINVIQDLRNLLEMLQRQSETGKKMVWSKRQYTDADYVLYISDLMIGSNCVMLRADDKEASYIGYNSFNYMRTSNAYFNEQERNWLNNLITKSTLISEVAEKQRNQFFKQLYRQVDELEQMVMNS